MAFEAAGYNTSTIDKISFYFYPSVHQFYNTASPEAPLLVSTRSPTESLAMVHSISNWQSLAELLHSITPISRFIDPVIRESFNILYKSWFRNSEVSYTADLFADFNADAQSKQEFDYWNRKADCLYDTFSRETPRFTIFNFNMAHWPFGFDEEGNYSEGNATSPARYMSNHRFSVQTLLKLVDMVIAEDPEAIIVLQADHGLQVSLGAITEYFHCTDEEAEGIWNQVMSAIRIPGEEMTQETQIILSDPRNISRYLINEYVGENYEYIPAQFRQVLKAKYTLVE